MNEWDAIKVKRIKRLRQISFPLKPFGHSERERESQREKPRGRAGLPEPEQRKQQVNGRSPMSDDWSTV